MDEWTARLASVAAIIALALMGWVVVHVLARRGRQALHSLLHAHGARRQQFVTLVQLLRWTANIVILTVAVMMLLSTLGVNITPLLASAGVAGLAISLGAQSLITDFIGGALILLENQYAVGDYIRVGDVSGQVERVTLRATHVRTLNGDLYVIPNGEVRIVGNQTKDWSGVLIDLGVAYEEDLTRAMAVLEESAAAFARKPEFAPEVIDAPQVLGVAGLGDSAVSVRIRLKTQPGKHLVIGRELRQHLLAACEREGITLPYPRQEVWVRREESG
jgi:small conductance mechanosensitive channel